MNLPLKPFFVYKSDVFGEFKNKNPEKKLSELTALIAESWNNLDAETKGIYEKKHEEALEKFNQSWVIDALDPPVKRSRKRHSDKSEKIQPASKKAKVQEKGNISTQISKSIELEQNRITNQRDGVYDAKYQILQQKNSSNYHDSLFDAICYIQKEFRSHMINYETKLRSIDWETEGWGWCGGYIPRYQSMNWSFDTTMIDLVKGANYKFENSKYLSELNEQIARIPTSKRYLTINILREKDFSPQAIKDVLSFIPRKINWKIRFQDDYCRNYDNRTLNRKFGSGYQNGHDGDYLPLSFYAWEVENDADAEHCVYKEGNEYGYEHNGDDEEDNEEKNEEEN